MIGKCIGNRSDAGQVVAGLTGRAKTAWKWRT
jgi:hypothetical protein